MSALAKQELCEQGQEQLARQSYVEAEQLLMQAERDAMHASDWDTLARLYMPLQEARRQRRQRATEGVLCLDLVSAGAGDHIEGRHIVENYPHGQLLVAGWGTIEPALQVRKLQARFRLYVDVFLAAKYPLIGGGHAVVIVPHEHVVLPDLSPRRWSDMGRVMPRHSIIVREEDLPQGMHRNDGHVLALVQGWWEKLHWPFMVDARDTSDLRKRVEMYRKAIRVDYACELAHQELSVVAKELARMQ